MKQNEARMSAKRLYKDISQSSNHTSEKQKNQEMLFRVAGWMCSCSWKMTSTYWKSLESTSLVQISENFHSVYEKLICNNYSGPIFKS